MGGTGSGKTLTSLVYAFETIQKGQTPIYPGHSFIKAAKDIPVYVITTPKKRDSCDWSKESDHVPIPLAKVDSWNNIEKYSAIKNSFFIFDEQRVIGSGVWVKSFLKIAANNEWIMLSATPADVWMDMVPLFIANGFYKNRTQFINEHVIYYRFSKYPKIERYMGITKLIRYRDLIFVHMPYKRKTTQHHKNIFCDYDAQKTKTLLVDRWNVFADRPIRDVSELCFNLRKVVNLDPSRIRELNTIFLKHKRLIIFYNFNYELDMLREWVFCNNIVSAEWNGHKHEAVPSGDSWVYLCQYTAAQEAWECILTDAMVLYSQTYSYKSLTQSVGRIDRMNTSYDDLYYYHFLSHSCIDLAIKKSLKEKESFNESRFLKL